MSNIRSELTELRSNIHAVGGWLSDNEASILFELAKDLQPEGEIVEIGSFKGKSTIALAKGLMKSNTMGIVWAIDPHEGIINTRGGNTFGKTFSDFQRNIKKAHVEHSVTPLVMTSKAASKKWNKPIRLLFLDGLHDYEHTSDDYKYWHSFVVSGGAIAFHDAFCGEEGVWNVIDKKVFRNHSIIDIGTVTSILYVIVGKPTFFSSIRVRMKKRLIRTAYWIHIHAFPSMIKKFIIHRGIRFLLLTKYTRAIY